MISRLTRSRSAIVIEIDEHTQLRILQSGDAEDLFRLTSQNRPRLREWLPWVDGTQSVDDTKRFIQTINEQHRNNEGFQSGIWHHGRLAGVIGYHRIDWPNKLVEIGYWLASEFEGKGLMTKACRALVEYAFNEFQLNRVQIRCATGNTRSCAIPERLGFVKEGLVRQAELLYNRYVDLVVYGMLSKDWNKERPEEDHAEPPPGSSTVEGIVKNLYECLTFEPGGKPNYDCLRSLCRTGTRFIPPGLKQTDSPMVLHMEEFVARFDEYVHNGEIGAKGLYQCELARRTELFGNVAHVFSAYESRYSRIDPLPIARGVNSIQLVHDKNRWWIVSIAWDLERPGNPLPKEFFPG